MKWTRVAARRSAGIGAEATLSVNAQNVLNRLQAYTHASGIAKSRRDRLCRTLSDLYERCSAGAHAEVTIDEARFVFLQTYVVLGEILMLDTPMAGTDPSVAVAGGPARTS